MKMSFAIVGSGAVGSYYGGRLAQAGHDVRFLLRADYDAVKIKGLRVESCDGDFHLPLVTCAKTPENLGKVDVVLVAWKTTSNASYEQVITPLLHEKTAIVTLQNGLGNVETLGTIFGPERILGALCFICLNRISPGLIRHSASGLIVMGGEAPQLPEIAQIFQASQINCQVTNHLPEAQWRKLVWNIPFNGLCITEGGIDTEELLSRPGRENEVRGLMEEVITTAQALGYEIERAFITAQIERTRPMGKYRPSSMIDYVEHRPVEVEAIWGEPLRQATTAGVAVPRLAALYREIKKRCS